MLRFRIGPIPVEVHPSHFLVAALMGLNQGAPWREQLLSVSVWVGVVFISVLVHELGHALVALSYGYRPSIELVWLGGYTRPNAPATPPWHRTFLVTLAGPTLGLGLAAVCHGAMVFLSGPPLLLAVLTIFVQANLFWAALNLVPIPPLDGGQLSMLLFRRLWGRKGERAALALGAVAGMGVALYASQQGSQFLAIILVLWGFRAGRLAVLMGNAPPPAGAEVANRALQQAQEKLTAGTLDEAETLAEQVALEEGLPLQRARSHRILGWIALKRGQGRRALDHFSQAQGTDIEPEAVAAAFSLIGDDVRALPLWEQAYSVRRNPTVLHEWAGALIRLGRLTDAEALPGVELGPAFGCAERVLFLRGDYAKAAQLGEEALQRAPTPGAAYDAACAYARGGQLDDAMRLLRRAKALGFRDRDFAEKDPDLSALHAHPEWPGFCAELTVA